MTEKRIVICPLCPYGCALEIKGKEGFPYQIEYLEKSFQGGRLCARGNAIPLILTHPKRCYQPNLDGKGVSWEKAFFELRKILSNYSPPSIAVGFDSYLTLEEKEQVLGLAQSLGVENQFYFNPENICGLRCEGVKEASFADLVNSDCILVIGDLFSRFPIFAQPILSARYQNKEKRLLVIDNYPNRLFGFADRAFLCPNGCEANIFTNPPQSVSNMLNLFAQAKRGVLILDSPPGKFLNPLSLIVHSQQFLRSCPGEKFFLPVVERTTGFGNKPLGEILAQIKSGEIKCLLFFGEVSIFNEYFDLSPLPHLIGTGSLNFHHLTFKQGALLLPVPHIVEREGSFPSFWGKNYNQGISSFSGTKEIGEIVERLAKELGITPKKVGFISSRILSERETKEVLKGTRLREVAEKQRERDLEICLINQEEAIEYGGFFDKGDRICLSPISAQRLNLKEGERVSVGEEGVALRVRIKKDLPEGLGLVSLANRLVKRLMKMEIDNQIKEVIIRPTYQKIWKR